MFCSFDYFIFAGQPRQIYSNEALSLSTWFYIENESELH